MCMSVNFAWRSAPAHPTLKKTRPELLTAVRVTRTHLSLCGTRGVSSLQAGWRWSPPQTGLAAPWRRFSRCRTAGCWCSVQQRNIDRQVSAETYKKKKKRRAALRLRSMRTADSGGCGGLDVFLGQTSGGQTPTLMMRSWLLGRCGSGGRFWLSVW